MQISDVLSAGKQLLYFTVFKGNLTGSEKTLIYFTHRHSWLGELSENWKEYWKENNFQKNYIWINDLSLCIQETPSFQPDWLLIFWEQIKKCINYAKFVLNYAWYTTDTIFIDWVNITLPKFHIKSKHTLNILRAKVQKVQKSMNYA